MSLISVWVVVFFLGFPIDSFIRHVDFLGDHSVSRFLFYHLKVLFILSILILFIVTSLVGYKIE